SFLNSSSTLLVTDELPMLELILHLEATPMHIGSSSGWLMLAGIIMCPAATSSRINSGDTRSRSATKTISSVSRPLRAKCICDILGSPVRSASSRRFVIHSARGFSGVLPLLPLVPLMISEYSSLNDYTSVHARWAEHYKRRLTTVIGG